MQIFTCLVVKKAYPTVERAKQIIEMIIMENFQTDIDNYRVASLIKKQIDTNLQT